MTRVCHVCHVCRVVCVCSWVWAWRSPWRWLAWGNRAWWSEFAQGPPPGGWRPRVTATAKCDQRPEKNCGLDLFFGTSRLMPIFDGD